MTKETGRALLARAALLAAALIWGGSFVIMKNSVDVFDPFYLLAFRFTAAAGILSAVLFPRLKKMKPGTVWRGAVIGVLLFAAYAFQTFGLTDTTPGKNAFLTAGYCILVPFFFWAVRGARPDRYNLTAAILCIAGVGLVSLDGEWSMGWGDAMTLVGSAFYAAHMVAVVKLGKDRDPLLITLFQFVGSAVCAWVLAALFETFPTTGWTLESIGGLAYLAVFATCVCLSFQIFGQQHTSPSAAAILLSFESVFGVLISVIVGMDAPTAQMIAGFVIIFAAVIVSETKLSFLEKGLRALKRGLHAKK